MPYIKRKLEAKLLNIFGGPSKKGLILAGIVGCGKTTLINQVIQELETTYLTFKFSGDDVAFRTAVSADTTYIYNHIRSHTGRRSLVFVDEIQKSENIFDAVKYAFDNADTSFIISGSNPDYLNTTARKRLQRRADSLILEPFSLSEILAHLGYINIEDTDNFREIILESGATLAEKVAAPGLSLSEERKKEVASIVHDYATFGGLPLAFLAASPDEKMVEIRKIVERGFESMSVDNDSIADSIRVELARLHSREFAYQGIFRKTGIRRRDLVNRVIDELINQGYLLKKKPYLENGNRRSYLTVFSYVDPGIVTYLTGVTPSDEIIGARIEGTAHALLNSIAANHIPVRSDLFYYKPYSIDANDKVKFREGEIDFIFSCGNKTAAIEVKATDNLSAISTPLLRTYVNDNDLPYGIVLYGGVPYWDQKSRLLYWPYWLI